MFVMPACLIACILAQADPNGDRALQEHNLQQLVSIDAPIKQCELHELLKDLSVKHSVVFEIDSKLFGKVGIKNILKATISVPKTSKIPMRTLLNQVLNGLGARCEAGTDCIVILPCVPGTQAAPHN